MKFEDWKSFKLGEIVDVKHGFAFKGAFFSDVPTKDILLSPGNFYIGGGFKQDKFKYYNGKFPKDYILKEGDIIVTMTDLSKDGDTIGYSAKIPFSNEKNYLHNQRLGLLVFKTNNFDKDFIYWLMRTKPYQNFIASSATGTTVRHTSPTRIREYEFTAPDLKVQTRIAAILTSLDDKIELNRQMNATLEGIAQTLFQEMCLPKAGERMEGWREGKIEDVLILQRGFDLPSTTRIEGAYPIIASSGINGYHNEFKNKAYGVTTGRSGVLGNVFYIQEDFWALNTSLFVKEFKIGHPIFSYFLLKTIDLKNYNGGSAVPTLNRNEVHKIEVIIPPLSNIDRFCSVAIKIYELIRNNEQETQTLTTLRDSLLPKLMRGELLI